MSDSETGGPVWQPESPFLDNYTPFLAERPSSAIDAAGSPFLAEFQLSDDESEEPPEPFGEIVDEILGDLESEDFSEGMQSLVDELAHLVRPPYGLEHEDSVEHAAVRAQLGELERAANDLIDRMGDAVAEVDPTSALEAEVEDMLEAVALEGGQRLPAFDQFLGGLKKKLKKFASKAVKLAKKGVAVVGKLALKPLLAKIKKLVRPLLDKVLKLAMDKIPEPYRPLARQLAERLRMAKAAEPAAADAAAPGADAAPPDAAPAPGAAPAPTEAAAPSVEPATEELDVQLAELLLNPVAFEQELVGEGPPAEEIAARDPIGDLDRSRERFVRQLGELGEGEPAAPVVEQFLPAIMLAIRTGIKLIGRPRVVSFLGGLIGKLIAPLVGKQNAPALGRLVADVGLRTLLQAEVDPAQHATLAGEALASTVEDTVRRVAALPEAVLDDRVAFEALAYEAFEAAAAANLPQSLVKPDRRESDDAPGWIPMPRGGRRLYKKLGRVFDVVVSPHIAGAVRTFGSGTLASFFGDRLRLRPGTPVAGRVHVYEATTRTRLSRIAKLEQVRGLGSGERAVWTQLHPLTPDAAALLLGAPRLGRILGEDAQPSEPAVGQRYYFLEIHEAPARPLGAESHVHVTLDFARDEIRACMHLSEVVAQRVSESLRKNTAPQAVLTDLRARLATHLAALSSDRSNRIVRVRFAGPRRRPRRPSTPALAAARRALRHQVARAALDWSWAALAERLPQLSADFIAKTEGPEDGAVICVTFRSPPGFRAVRRFLRGVDGSPPQWSPARPSGATISIKPGPKHG